MDNQVIDLSSSLALDLQRVVYNTALADLRITTGEEDTVSRVVKALICAKSDYLLQFFSKYERQEDQPAEISLKQLKTDSFKQIVEYCYTGKLYINSHTAFELLRCAHMLQMKALKESILNYLLTNVNVDNVIRFFRIAQKYQIESLLSRAREIMTESAEILVLTDEFVQAASEAEFARLLSSPSVKIREVTKFRGIVKWARHQKEKNKLEVPEMRIAQKLLPFVKYEAISGSDLNEYVVPANVLTADQLKILFCNQVAIGHHFKAQEVQKEEEFKMLFTNMPDEMKLEDDGRKVTKGGYGEGMVCLSNAKVSDLFRAQIRVEHGGFKDTGYFGFGLCTQELVKVKPFVCNRDSGKYISFLNYKGNGMICCGELKIFTFYGEAYKEGDVIGIEGDLSMGEIIFTKNGKKFNVIDIKKLGTQEFHLAVWLNYNGDSFQLL